MQCFQTPTASGGTQEQRPRAYGGASPDVRPATFIDAQDTDMVDMNPRQVNARN